MRKGILRFHQGWTDIINQLSLINYYSERYDLIELYMRGDSKPMIDFYCRNLKNVNINYTDNFLNMENLDEYDFLLHGCFDVHRKDMYSNKFNMNLPNMDYISSFYLSYGIPMETKIDYFSIERDIEMEDNEYKKFINQHGCEYILYHSDSHSFFAKTGIDIEELIKHKQIKCVCLSGILDNPFISLKILQNAKEIHLTDSMWGSFCYLMDCKYNFFENISISFYPFKNRCGGLFCDDETRKTYNWTPQYEFHTKNLKNWYIIKK